MFQKLIFASRSPDSASYTLISGKRVVNALDTDVNLNFENISLAKINVNYSSVLLLGLL